MYTGLDVLNKTCRLEQAIIKDKLAFLRLSSNRAEVPITSEQIEKLVGLVKSDYEYILIDSPAGRLELANEALVVVTPEGSRDADRVIVIIMSKGINQISLIINRIRPNMVRTDDMMYIEDVTNILGITLISVIPDSEKIIASNRGEPIVLEDKNCLPGVAFENTARRLTGEKVNFLNLESMSGKNPVKRIIGKLINRSNSY